MTIAQGVAQHVRLPSGDVGTAFWRRVCNPADAYGGEVITGWAARFYPYLKSEGVIDLPNPLLDLKIGQPPVTSTSCGPDGSAKSERQTT